MRFNENSKKSNTNFGHNNNKSKSDNNNNNNEKPRKLQANFGAPTIPEKQLNNRLLATPSCAVTKFQPLIRVKHGFTRE